MNRIDYTAPIDLVHAMQLQAVERIRAQVELLHAKVAEWQPRPCPPPSWQPEARTAFKIEQERRARYGRHV